MGRAMIFSCDRKQWRLVQGGTLKKAQIEYKWSKMRGKKSEYFGVIIKLIKRRAAIECILWKHLWMA